MVRAPILLALLLCLSVSTSQTTQAIDTIDCARDHNPAERTICDSQHLQILDAQIVEVYAELMTSRWLAPARKADLKQSQRTFLVRRDACGYNPDCLEDVMAVRASRIQNYR
jgi:uncharacterized protein